MYAVREEHRDARLGLGFTQSLDGEPQSVADGRTVLRLNRDDFEIARDRDDILVVERQRARGVGVPGKAHETDRVVGPALEIAAAEHERFENVLDGLQARAFPIVGGKIERLH